MKKERECGRRRIEVSKGDGRGVTNTGNEQMAVGHKKKGDAAK